MRMQAFDEESAMHCSSCRAALPERARFCMACGAPVLRTCAACGHSNPPQARFCVDCGAILAEHASGDSSSGTALVAMEPAPASAVALPERRHLTVLFCDLVGSTALSIRLDPEDLTEVIAAFHRCVAETVARFDGFVARYMGDGALVYFGYPHAHEDNAERAVRAAMALMSKIGALDVHGERLSARIGIATGLVVVGEMANAGATREQMALGEAPNLAARLQTLAAPGATVIAENTRRLVGTPFDYRDLGEIELKGFEEPVRVWQVMGRRRTERDADGAPGAGSGADALHRATPLVGREQERGLLRDRFAQAAEGEGCVVLLSGEAGVGKSRLVQTLLSDVANEPHSLIEFRCSAHYVNSPLYPIVRLLRVTLELNPDDPDAVKREKLEAFCTRNGVSADEGLPLLASLLALPPSARHPLPPMSPERQKQRTLQTLLAVVLRMADEKPVLLVVEDLHWIDPTTTELLVLLVNQMATSRVFALFTARLEFAPPWPSHSYVTSLALARFTRRQSEQMVERVARGKPLPADVVREIVAKTDGVPLFVEELTKMVLESDLIGLRDEHGARTAAPVPLAIPETLQDSLTARLDRLSTVKTVAQLGATLGREFSYGMLKAVAALDDETLQRDLARLVDAELLYQKGALPEATYLFKHALIQEAAYQSLLKSTRAQYHERIARVVVEQFASEAQARPEFVAMHYTEAGNLDPAVGWWQKAGQLAFRRASYAEAIAHYTRGLAVLEMLPSSEQRDQSELGLQVELGYALIPVKGWAAPMSAQTFTRAGELCSRLGDVPKQFRALWGLGAFHFVRGDQHQTRPVAEQCLGVARRANDVDAMIEAHYLSGIVACAIGEFDAAEHDLRACIRLYGDEERPMHRLLYGQDAKASALGWLAMERCTRGHTEEAVACANQALDLVRNSTQPFLLARGHASIGFVNVLRREPQGPDSPLSAALALCAEQGFVYFNAVCSTFQGANLVFLGEAQEGIALIRANVAFLRKIGSELLFTLILGHLAAAHLSLKQVEEGLQAVAEGLACVEKNGERWGEAELHRLRGELLLQGGQREAALASFDRAMDVARQQQAKTYELRAACSLARLWSAEGRLAEARSLVSDVLRAWPDQLDSADLRDARAIVGFK